MLPFTGASLATERPFTWPKSCIRQKHLSCRHFQLSVEAEVWRMIRTHIQAAAAVLAAALLLTGCASGSVTGGGKLRVTV
jgi:predicted small secreted protein